MAPVPWHHGEAPPEPLPVVIEHREAYGVTGLAGGRFHFQRGESAWEWHSSSTDFDGFCTTTLRVDVTELIVVADDTTFELLMVTLQAQSSTVLIVRLDP
jgi:hypothetical protein